MQDAYYIAFIFPFTYNLVEYGHFHIHILSINIFELKVVFGLWYQVYGTRGSFGGSEGCLFFFKQTFALVN